MGTRHYDSEHRHSSRRRQRTDRRPLGSRSRSRRPHRRARQSDQRSCSGSRRRRHTQRPHAESSSSSSSPTSRVQATVQQDLSPTVTQGTGVSSDAQVMAAFSWSFERDVPTLVVDAYALKDELIRYGRNLGQGVCEFKQVGQGYEYSPARFPANSVLYAPFDTDVAGRFAVAAFGSNQDRRQRCLGFALAIAATVVCSCKPPPAVAPDLVSHLRVEFNAATSRNVHRPPRAQTALIEGASTLSAVGEQAKCFAARVEELEDLLTKQRQTSSESLEMAQTDADEHLRSKDSQIQELQAQISQQREAAVVAANEAKARFSELQGDLRDAMAQAQTVGNRLHDSDSRNEVLQAQLTDQQQAASAENSSAAGRISALEARLTEQESNTREVEDLRSALRASENMLKRTMADSLEEAKRSSARIEELEDLLTKQHQTSSDSLKAAQEHLRIEASQNQELQAQISQQRKAAVVEAHEANARFSKLQAQLTDQQQAASAENSSAAGRISELEAHLLEQESNTREVEDLRSALRASEDLLKRTMEESLGEAKRSSARIEQLEDLMSKQHQTSSDSLEMVQDRLRIEDSQNRELQVQISQQREAAVVAAHEANARFSKLQAQLTEQQQAASAENSSAAGRVSELEARLTEQERKTREVVSDARRDAQQHLDRAEAKCTDLKAYIAKQPAHVDILTGVVQNFAKDTVATYSGVAQKAKMPEPGRITNVFRNIWLGDEAAAENDKTLHQHGITHIISCIGAPKGRQTVEVERLDLNAKDEPHYDILQHLQRVLEFVSGNPRDSKILVYCRKGINRSASLVVAMLMKEKNREGLPRSDLLRKAWSEVLCKHGQILTNPGFRRQLMLFAYSGCRLSIYKELTSGPNFFHFLQATE